MVGRSGGSLAEIAALGRPAVLVPYPYASADHQRKNAAWAEQGGAAIVVADASSPVSIARDLVRGLLADSGRLGAMAAASRRLGRPEATQHVVDEIGRLLARRTS